MPRHSKPPRGISHRVLNLFFPRKDLTREQFRDRVILSITYTIVAFFIFSFGWYQYGLFFFFPLFITIPFTMPGWAAVFCCIWLFPHANPSDTLILLTIVIPSIPWAQWLNWRIADKILRVDEGHYLTPEEENHGELVRLLYGFRNMFFPQKDMNKDQYRKTFFASIPLALVFVFIAAYSIFYLEVSLKQDNLSFILLAFSMFFGYSGWIVGIVIGELLYPRYENLLWIPFAAGAFPWNYWLSWNITVAMKKNGEKSKVSRNLWRRNP